MNDFIDKFNQVPFSQRVMLLVLVLAGLGIGFTYLVYGPVTQEISDQKVKLNNLKQEKQNLARRKDKKARIQAKIAQLEQDLLIAKEKLPESAEIPSLLQRIYNQANTAGLEIRNFTPTAHQAQAYYIEIPVNMELVGTYDELANFFYYVGRMTRIVNVKDLDIKRRKGGLNDDGSLTVTAQATTFQMKAGGGEAKK